MSEDFPSYEELEAKLWMAEHERDQLRKENAELEAQILYWKVRCSGFQKITSSLANKRKEE